MTSGPRIDPGHGALILQCRDPAPERVTLDNVVHAGTVTHRLRTHNVEPARFPPSAAITVRMESMAFDGKSRAELYVRPIERGWQKRSVFREYGYFLEV